MYIQGKQDVASHLHWLSAPPPPPPQPPTGITYHSTPVLASQKPGSHLPSDLLDFPIYIGIWGLVIRYEDGDGNLKNVACRELLSRAQGRIVFAMGKDFNRRIIVAVNRDQVLGKHSRIICAKLVSCSSKTAECKIGLVLDLGFAALLHIRRGYWAP